MIRRLPFKNLSVYEGDAPRASEQLDQDGYALLRKVFTPDEVQQMRDEIDAAFVNYPAERGRTDKDEFRYEMVNRSPACQRAVANPRILEAIEPLLGDDCHLIANTAWRNPPDFQGGVWHCDAGPHVPRPEGVPWDDRIPYPIFAVASHLLLQDCAVADGPTSVVPGSHRSGRLAPSDQITATKLSYEGRENVKLTAKAGDVVLFVSDIWHRGLPAKANGRGRFFLQAHYARRDIAQRIRTTEDVNHLSSEAIERADSDRARTLVGLHNPFFYDG